MSKNNDAPQPDAASNAERFTGLADIYATHRPSYPHTVIEALAERARATGAPTTAIDIGCGTGISTLAIARALPDWHVIAAEPNRDMLEKARVHCAGCGNIVFVTNGAEALPGDENSAGLVLAAQAIHWFDRPKFFAEAARVLPSGGLVAVLYNNRQNAVSAVLCEIEDYLESIDQTYSRDYRARDIPAMLEGLDDFENVDRIREIWLKPTSVDDLVNYFMSRSMLQPLAKKAGVAKIRHRIGDIADTHATAGMIDVPFATELDLASRR
ncbi:MAG: class I SAM-dependent methyltransferase [Alphaproteobacteria bacterium]|nr:class I SAM-dependent methyltransferase [Alphaproteobacteria bacterium]